MYNLNDTLKFNQRLIRERTKIGMKEYNGQENIRFKFEYQSLSGYWGIDDVFLTNERVSSTKDIEHQKMVHIWPSPVSERLYISVQVPMQKLDILGCDGRVLLQSSQVPNATNEISVDVSDFPKGMYFAKIRTHSGIFVEQFVVVK